MVVVLARRAGRFSPIAVVAYPVGVAFLTVVLAVMCVVGRIACRPRMLEDTLR